MNAANRILRSAAAGLACAAGAAGISVPAAGEGLSRILPAITRTVTDARPIEQGSHTSFRVVRPTLEIAPGRAAGDVAALGLSDDNSLLFVVLGDGSARLWDLDRGLQLGNAFGDGIVSGVARGSGADAEAVALRRDGASVVFHPDGSIRRGAVHAVLTDDAHEAVLSADGRAAAFRASGGNWRVQLQGAVIALPGAAAGFPPILSPGGGRAVYRLQSGAMAAAVLPGGGREAAAWQLEPCAANAAVTAGAFAPDGTRVVLGDEAGNICIRRFPHRSETGIFLGPRMAAHNRPVRSVVLDQDHSGTWMATRDDDGVVHVRNAAAPGRPLARFVAAGKDAGPLALDSRRKWVFVGGKDGTVGIHSYARTAQARIARLISARDDGWAVLDSAGRFDGAQNGVDALVWVEDAEGDMPPVNLPVDAFGEGWFEPGLLARMDDDEPGFITGEVRSLSEDGYEAPPRVAIDPVDTSAAGQAAVRVRLADADYPREAVSEVRLYHNGILVPEDGAQADAGGRAYEFRIPLSPGENRFSAVGVGPDDVESAPAVARPVFAAAPALRPVRPRMRVVSVGINDYPRPWDPLEYSLNDARELVFELRGRGRSLFTEVDAVTLLDSDAAAAAIERRIGDSAASGDVMPEDVLIVFFSGHGHAVKEGDRTEWYLIPFRSAWDRGVSGYDAIARRHGVSSGTLMKALIGTGAKRIFLILDSCKSGVVADAMEQDGFFQNAAEQRALHSLARKSGIHILAAARADEAAIPLRSAPHGALTYLLLEGLRGKADANGDEAVTVKEVMDYAEDQMPRLSRRLVRMERIDQRPVARAGEVDFALAVL